MFSAGGGRWVVNHLPVATAIDTISEGDTRPAGRRLALTKKALQPACVPGSGSVRVYHSHIQRTLTLMLMLMLMPRQIRMYICTVGQPQHTHAIDLYFGVRSIPNMPAQSAESNSLSHRLPATHRPLLPLILVRKNRNICKHTLPHRHTDTETQTRHTSMHGTEPPTAHARHIPFQECSVFCSPAFAELVREFFQKLARSKPGTRDQGPGTRDQAILIGSSTRADFKAQVGKSSPDSALSAPVLPGN